MASFGKEGIVPLIFLYFFVRFRNEASLFIGSDMKILGAFGRVMLSVMENFDGLFCGESFPKRTTFQIVENFICLKYRYLAFKNGKLCLFVDN